jgi:hypothetical protein
MKKLKNLLIAFLTNFMIVCFVVLFAQIFIGALIFGQKSVIISHFYIQIPILVLVSILLTLFYQINNITVTIQTFVTYLTMLLLSYSFGFFNGWFAFDNIKFLIISLLLNAIGLTITITILLIRKKHQTDILNKQLLSIKERAQYEEN